MFVADMDLQQVHILSLEGTFQNSIGTPVRDNDPTDKSPGSLFCPTAICFLHDFVYVLQRDRGKSRRGFRVAPEHCKVVELRGIESNRISKLYISDRSNDVIHVDTLDGLDCRYRNSYGQGLLETPSHLTYLEYESLLVVTDRDNDRITVFNRKFQVIHRVEIPKMWIAVLGMCSWTRDKFVISTVHGLGVYRVNSSEFEIISETEEKFQVSERMSIRNLLPISAYRGRLYLLHPGEKTIFVYN
jgi:hypothetical protein